MAKESIEDIATRLFGEMRDLTPEEREMHQDWLSRVSVKTGLNIYDILDEDAKKEPYVKHAEEDMAFQAELVLYDLMEYAENHHIEPDFIFETFIKMFRKKLNHLKD